MNSDLEEQPDVHQLIDDLRYGDVRARYIAALTLEQLRPIAALPALIDALHHDEHWYIRNSAAKALGNLNHPDTFNALIIALADHNPGVRKSAALSLGSKRDQRAVPMLAGLLEDDRHYVRQASITALSQIGNRSAINALIHAIRTDNQRPEALEALRSIGTEEAIAALERL